MNLTDLPEEILIIIIQQLDIKSIYNLFNTCRRLKKSISMKGVIKKCHLSMNTLATATSLNTDFFKAIAPHLVELNLSGVPDLRKSNLMPTMKKMKNLQTLDVSFTNINLPDFPDIYDRCPTIKNVSLNFMINKSETSRIADDTIIQFQEIFANFQCVHFVGSAINLLYSKLPFLLLQESSLDCLKYTIAETDHLHTIYIPEQAKIVGMVRFKRFFICFLDWTPGLASYYSLHCLSMFDLSAIESIFIFKENFKQYSINTSPIFQTYLQENFDVGPDKIFPTNNTSCICGNAVMLIWNKEAHDFDDKFFRGLHKILKPVFPCDCRLYSKKSVPEKYDWFYITPEPADRADNNCETPPTSYKFRRTRTAPPINVLNYDELFKTKKRVQLSLIFDEFLRNPITLPTDCNYLEKLTFLSMIGAVRLSADFFNILFTNCVNLVTVSIDSPSMQSCVLPVSRAISLSSGLKNLRLTEKRIDFELLFSSLAKCKTLENVHIADVTATEEILDIGDPSLLIDECPNLYSLYIRAPLSETNRIRKTQILNNAKMSRNKHYLNLVLNVNLGHLSRKLYSYDPFLSVFNINPIKHIEAF